MAERRPRPVRSLISLAVIVFIIAGAIFAGTKFSDASFTPKLALDLEGGTQIILTPQTEDGSEVTADDINQAIKIIRQRVDASGVSEAEITRQGSQNIVVALPGEPSQETLDLVRRSAQLRFRPVIVASGPLAIDAENLKLVLEDERPDFEISDDATVDELAFAAADQDGDGVLSTEPSTTPTSNSDGAWVTEQILYDYYTLDCSDPSNLDGGDQTPSGDPMVACDSTGASKFIVGPTDIEGTHVTQASSGLKTTGQGAVTNEWQVSMEFDSEGAQLFADVTARLATLDSPQDQFAVVLDGLVVSNPYVSESITGGQASISGSGINRESAATLANQLSFGSLPLNFTVQSEEQLSATLGDHQLELGIMAGLIGFALVIIYMIFQYHALGFVALASLGLALGLTYLTITLLSWLMGYRLSLAGVAGLIISIGITVDSFILYFERIRDEVREGRILTDAAQYGWRRARTTIFASDSVNFVAALVLYFLAVGGVRGFAFTLGLTTLIDLVVVILFTYPLMTLLVRTRYFGEGRRFSGLDPVRLGSTVSYRGRGTFEPGTKGSKLSIAERKAAAAQEVDAS